MNTFALPVKPRARELFAEPDPMYVNDNWPEWPDKESRPNRIGIAMFAAEVTLRVTVSKVVGVLLILIPSVIVELISIPEVIVEFAEKFVARTLFPSVNAPA